ncbi:MAG: aldehyde dehydrogenase family protein [Leptospiraceae bacterium]|nr:aldehyde dehydrogenase family protein [Leptospiraceae bacterium]MCK6382108.1 aldehyde dehydrogenase family protein [Leptospiraceae bacterium]NUM42106.1 aldehyde dehydrogenase family protein [Leptospiraceae bacterium]
MKKITTSNLKKKSISLKISKTSKISKKKTKEMFTVLNPATLKPIGELPVFSREMVEEKILIAKKEYSTWSKLSLKDRSKIILKFRKILAQSREEMISTICEETGKTRMDALIEVFAECEATTYVAKKGIKYLSNEKRSSGLMQMKSCYVNYHPFGVVGIISPWNYPLILSLNPILNALMAGNTVVIKPSEITPYTTLKVQEFFKRAGLPDGALQVITGKGETGAALVESKNTDMICFTGSTRTGRIIGEACGKMLKPVILELGGKDPMIVFEDADLVRAAKGALWGGFFNSGQTCISVERVYVEKSVFQKFIEIVKNEYNHVRQGLTENFPSVGSMTFDKQVEIVESHYSDAKKKGANLILGGSRKLGHDGLFHEPSVVVNVSHEMKIMKEETFGPEIAIMEFSSEEEAINLANDTNYGLNASVWTKDSKKAKRVAESIKSGSVCINDCLTNYMISDLPFGGFKESGLGRVHGKEGIRAFAQSQSIMKNRWFWIFKKELWWFPYSKRIYNLFSKAVDLLFG